MRNLVIVLSFAALAAPVAAHAQIAEVELPPSDIADTGHDMGDADDDAVDPAYSGASPYDDVADILDDPVRQDEIADAMSDMLRALMTIRFGPIVDAARRIDPDVDIAAAGPDATIGDIASRGDPDYEDRIEDGIRHGTALSGTMVREFAKMMPGLIAIAKDLGAQAEQAMRERNRR